MTTSKTLDTPTAKLLTREQAAAYLNVRPQTLAKWHTTKAHSLPLVRVGRCVRYRLRDLDKFIEENTEG